MIYCKESFLLALGVPRIDSDLRLKNPLSKIYAHPEDISTLKNQWTPDQHRKLKKDSLNLANTW